MGQSKSKVTSCDDRTPRSYLSCLSNHISTYIPENLIANEILPRLSLSSFPILQLVNRSWYGLLTNREDYSLFQDKGRHNLLVQQTWCSSPISRIVYLIEEELHSRSSTEVKSKLKLPLVPSRHSKVEKVYLIRLDPGEHIFKIVNCCNGLLCLLNSRTGVLAASNPVTGEYLLASQTETTKHGGGGRLYALGYSSQSRTYSFVKISCVATSDSIGTIFRADVQRVGTSAWTAHDQFVAGKFSLPEPHRLCYLSGNLYFICKSDKSKGFIAKYSLDQSVFHLEPVPESCLFPRVCILGNKLCIYSNLQNQAVIWSKPLREWSATYVIDFISSGTRTGLRPLLLLNNSRLLVLYDSISSRLVFYDTTSGITSFKRLMISEGKALFQVTPFIGSHISLKQLVGTETVKNVQSGCGKLKLLQDLRRLFLGDPVSLPITNLGHPD